MSFLTLIQSAATQLGLNSPSTALTSTDPQVIQLVSLAQVEGVDLMRRHPWPVLTAEKTFTGTAAAVQTNAIPTAFDRFIDGTFWNRTQKRPLYGPISAADWQEAQVWTATQITESFRVRGSDILITPTPTTDTYAYEYISKNFCSSSGGTGQAAWALDTDLAVLPEDVMTLGVVWRFLRAKGFDYAEAMRTYELRVADAFGHQGGRRIYKFGTRVHFRPHPPFIADGSWPL